MEVYLKKDLNINTIKKCFILSPNNSNIAKATSDNRK